MIDSRLAMYHKGAITADHFILMSLNMVDPENPSLVLASIPEELLERMLEVTRRYRPGHMIMNQGPLPTIDQVDAARRWIEGQRCTVALPSSLISPSS